MTRSVSKAALAALTLTAAAPVSAQLDPTAPVSPAPRAADRRVVAFSAHAGPILGGELVVENGSETYWDVDPGLVLRGAADFHVAPKITLGAYVLTAQMSLPERGDEDFGVVGFGGTIMGRFGQPTRPHLRAGLSLGVQTNSFETEAVDGSMGLGLSGILEFAYPFGGSGAALLGHLSFLTQPTGGNDDYWVTFGPMVYFALGAEFGL